MKKIFSSQWSKKIIFWYFLGFLWSFTRKTPENLKKQSVSIIVSIFVKKISPNNVRDFFFLLFIREKKICLWTLWNFSWPSATRNFKIGFTRKCSSHSWTGEKRSLTVGEIFFTQKRDNYTNKVLVDHFGVGSIPGDNNFSLFFHLKFFHWVWRGIVEEKILKTKLFYLFHYFQALY